MHGKPLSTSEIAYTWQPIKQEKRNGIITGYTLTLRNVDGSVKKSFSSNASTVRLTVNGLESWTNYTADISGMTIKGSGPPSPQVLVATLEEGNQLIYEYLQSKIIYIIQSKVLFKRMIKFINFYTNIYVTCSFTAVFIRNSFFIMFKIDINIRLF